MEAMSIMPKVIYVEEPYPSYTHTHLGRHDGSKIPRAMQKEEGGAKHKEC
jgi:hypothetical protein